MSIADKLTLIANNMDDVRDAGYKKAMNEFCPPFNEIGGIVQFVPVAGSEVEVWHDGDYLVVCGKNLYNAKEYPMVANTMVRYGTGAAVASSTYAATVEYIPVEHLRGKKIAIRHCAFSTNGSTAAGLAFYDAEKAYITEGSTREATTTVPINACFMRFSINQEAQYLNEAQIELGNSVTDYEPYIADTYETKSITFDVVRKNLWTIFAVRNVIDDSRLAPSVEVTGLEDPITVINNLRNQLTPTSTEG